MANTKKCVFLDFETRSKRNIEDGAFAYANDPSTEILITALAVEDGPPRCSEHLHTDLIDYIQKGYTIIAHNMLFEIAICKHVLLLDINPSQWRCTFQMASRANLPMNLAGAANSLNVTKKLESGTNLIKLFSLPRADGKFNEMDSHPREKEKFIEYCANDAEVSREIWRNLAEFKDCELNRIQQDLESNLLGVRVDWKLASHIYLTCLREQEKFAERVTELTGGLITKMTQVQRVKAWAQNHISPEIASCNADTIVEILDGNYGEVDDVSKEILEMRQHSGKSSIGKYIRFKDSHVNGRVYGMIISFGTGTGRTISKLLNLNNLPKPSVEYESMEELTKDLSVMYPKEINEKYGSYLKSASSAIRGMIIPREGYTLIDADYSSVEARIVAWLAGCYKSINVFVEGRDPYVVMSSVIFGVTYDKVTADQRWVGKQAVLGCGFGLAWKGFQNTCLNYGREIPDELCQTTISSYRETYYEIPELWDELHKGSLLACKTGKIVKCAKGKIVFKTMRTISGILMLMMKIPSGRVLFYPDVKLQMCKKPWGARELSVTYKKVTNGQWLRTSTYGGKLTENAVQAIASDIMYYGASCVKKLGYDVLFSVYDEVISEIEIAKADLKEYELALCELEPWAEGIPLEAEGKLLGRYQKV